MTDETPTCKDCGCALEWGYDWGEPEDGEWVCPVCSQEHYEHICSHCGSPTEYKTLAVYVVDIEGEEWLEEKRRYACTCGHTWTLYFPIEAW